MGPIPGFGGPFKSAAEYFTAWANLHKPNIGLKPQQNQDFPARLEKIALKLSTHDAGPFSLVHVDFGSYNILVDDDYNICSIIDWDCASVLPIEFAAVYPADFGNLPDVFWMGSPMDNDQRRMEEAAEKKIRQRYITFLGIEEKEKGYAVQLSLHLESLRAFIAFSMRLYSEGSQNPLCKIIDIFEEQCSGLNLGRTDK